MCILVVGQLFAQEIIQIGDGSELSYSPVNVVFDYSYSQTIYLQEEINLSDNEIYKIEFFWTGGLSTPRDKIFEIYMGHTTENNFIDSWPQYVNTILPISIFTKVFDGTVLLPDEPGWIEINLDIPFLYNNLDNLAIAINQVMPGFLLNEEMPFAGQFYASHTPERNNRTEVRYRPTDRLYWENIEEEAHNWFWLDPILRYDMTPNIRFHFKPSSPEPIFTITPIEHSFSILSAGETSEPAVFTIRNLGHGPLSILNTAITGQHHEHFRIDLFPSDQDLSYLETTTIEVVFEPLSAGDKVAYLTIVDNYSTLPYYVMLSGRGLSSTSISHEIGTGNIEIPNLPVHANWDQSYSQFIYLQSEIDIADSEIISLSFYYNGHPGWNVISNWDIYLAHTELEQFPTLSYTPNDFVSISEFALVYSGNIAFTSTPGWVQIDLDTPFEYNNVQNLMIAVNRIGGGGWANGPAFLSTASLPQRRGIVLAQDGAVLNPENIIIGGMTAGIVALNNIPNIRFLFNASEMPTEELFPPILLTPQNNAINTPLEVSLNWINNPLGIQPDAYLIYFGETNPPPFIISLPREINSWTPPIPLEHNTIYYWQIISTSLFDYNDAPSNIFAFTTKQVTSIDENQIIPLKTILGNNYPNPFNPITTINFTLNIETNLKIDIHNIKGQKVKSLLNEYRPAGVHNIVWNGKDDNGNDVGSGVYFYRMESEGYVSTKKMVMIK